MSDGQPDTDKHAHYNLLTIFLHFCTRILNVFTVLSAKSHRPYWPDRVAQGGSLLVCFHCYQSIIVRNWRSDHDRRCNTTPRCTGDPWAEVSTFSRGTGF